MTVTQVGACSVVEGPNYDAGGPVGSPGVRASAGVVTIDLPRAGTFTLLPPLYRPTATDGGSKDDFGQIFFAGDLIRVSASGDADGAPAFCDQTLAAPPDIESTDPPLSPKEPITISRAQDFVIRFSPTGPGEVQLSMGTYNSTVGNVVGIACKAAATAGMITVPKEALAKLHLEASTAGYNGAMNLYPSNATTVVAGGYTIEIQATAVSASGTVLFEQKRLRNRARSRKN